MNEAMGTLAGELIQMNSRMVMTDMAEALTALGCVVAIAFLAAMLVGLASGRKRWWLGLIGWAAALALAAAGCNMPRVKEIHACVNGPISLEAVSAAYDIVDIDGKELVLRVRRAR